MYNIAISTVAGLAVFALASVWLGPIAGIIPALIVMIGVMYGLSRRTAAQVEAEMQRIVPLLQNRQIPEALALLDDVKKRYGPWQLLLEGQIDSQIGMIDYLQLKFDDALPKLEKGKWRNWSALTCIGCIHWRKGAKEAAYKELSDAASVAGKESIVYLVWATLLTRDGERQRALEVLDQGLKEMPDSEHLKNLHKVVANKKKINTKVFPQTWYQFFPEEMAQQMMMRGRRDGPPPGMPEAPNQRISARRAPGDDAVTRKDLLNAPARSVSIAVVDLEMTGLRAESDRVCEIAVIRADGSEVLLEYDTLVRPPVDMSEGAVRVSGITPEMLVDAPLFPEVAPEVEEALSGAVLVAHNVPHDLVFLDREMRQSGVDMGPPVSLDTLEMSRRLFAFPRNNLVEVCERLKIELQTHHRALADARATFLAYHQMLDILDPQGVLTVEELLDLLGALAPNSPYRRQMERRLRDAFRLRRTVIIDYISTSDPLEGIVKREVSIWKLKVPRIQGWCHLREGERVFRMDRIRSVDLTENTYEIPADFDSRI